jgi:hypothetical protein
MTRSAKSPFRVLVAAAMLVAPAAQAKVFRRGGAAPDELNNGSLPWENAYRANMTVNGRPARMHIYSARFSEPVVEQLKARFQSLGATVRVAGSRDGATGTAVWPDREASFIVLAPHDQPRQTIMVYFPEAGKKTGKVVFPVPEFKRGKTLTTISDDDTNTFLATIETPVSATEAHSFYAGALQGEGWTLAAPALVDNGTISGMAVYQKKERVCYVQATDRMAGLNMVTLLVKGGTL